MNLNTMMAKMETLMANNKLDLPYLRFENPFGVEMPLPFVACEVWDVSNFIRYKICGEADKILGAA